MSISSSKTFYTLDESRAFESDPRIKIVYFTEKGIDLLAVVPEAAHIEYATRMGFSWYHIINNPPSFVVKSHQPQKQVRIVRTTEAELAAHTATHTATHTSAQPSQQSQQSQPLQIKLQVDHKAAMLAEIDALPTSELTQDRLADLITDYMIKHGIHDFVIADEICVILGSRGILKAAEETKSVISTAAAEEDTTSFDQEHEQTEQTVSSIGSISAWLVSSFDSVVTSVQQMTLNILPIPNNTDWILVD